MIRHIVALDSKRGIARRGSQPWKLPGDEKYFSDQTKRFGGVVLMGRKTFKVIGKPLSDRQNYVLTRNEEFDAEGVTTVRDIDSFLKEHPDVWIIGGAELYELTLSRADELYITEIDADFDCDRFYPDYGRFREVETSEHIAENGTGYVFKIFKPVRAKAK